MRKLYIYSLLAVLFGAGCSKQEEPDYVPALSLNVINAWVGGAAIKLSPGTSPNFIYRTADNVAYGANLFSPVLAGSSTVSVASATDTTKVLFTRNVNLTNRMSTLYICGQSPAVDTIFREEPEVPFIQSYTARPDSSVYIRFVNLCPNSPPMSINIKGGTTEVASLPYKGITAFKKYAARSTSASYIFELRNASTNQVLFTTPAYTENNLRHRTVALVIRGITVVPPATTTTPLAVSQVNYY